MPNKPVKQMREQNTTSHVHAGPTRGRQTNCTSSVIQRTCTTQLYRMPRYIHASAICGTSCLSHWHARRALYMPRHATMRRSVCSVRSMHSTSLYNGVIPATTGHASLAPAPVREPMTCNLCANILCTLVERYSMLATHGCTFVNEPEALLH